MSPRSSRLDSLWPGTRCKARRLSALRFARHSWLLASCCSSCSSATYRTRPCGGGKARWQANHFSSKSQVGESSTVPPFEVLWKPQWGSQNQHTDCGKATATWITTRPVGSRPTKSPAWLTKGCRKVPGWLERRARGMVRRLHHERRAQCSGPYSDFGMPWFALRKHKASCSGCQPHSGGWRL